jgi:uncharacterized protein (DUF58 family)
MFKKRAEWTPRKLQVSPAGIWYVGLTILLGVTAMASGNSIVYVFESLLLSGLILSGILSERQISGIEVEIRRRQARAQEPTRDIIHVTNRRFTPAFCMEIGEWRNNRFEPMIFITRLAPQSSVVLSSRQVIRERGAHEWQSLVIATSFPFGFARKLMLLPSAGKRLVWPAPLFSKPGIQNADSNFSGSKAGTSVVDGEVRSMTFGDDYRLIVWPLSAKGTEPQVRTRKSEKPSPEAVLDLRTAPGEEFEQRVRETAHQFYSQESIPSKTDSGSLTLLGLNGKRQILGSRKALDELATVRASEDAA